MAFKICVLFAMLAVASAGVISAPGYLQAAPLAVAKVATIDPNYDPNPQYSYSYSVQDALTGDSKTSEETRSGDVVQGSYSLVEADGTLRTVRYTADPVNGFNAVVEKSGAAIAAAPVVKQVVAQPIVKQIVQAAPQYIQAAPQLIRAAPQIVQAAPQYIQAAPQLIRAIQPQLVQQQYIQAAPQLLRAAPQLVHAAPQLVHAAPQLVHAAPALLKTSIAPQVSTTHVVTNHAAYAW